jgi:hypothetical protein
MCCSRDTVAVVFLLCSTKGKLFAPRKTASDDLGVGSAFLTQVSPRSSADTPVSVVPSMRPDGRFRGDYGGADTHRADEIEDLILDGESRKTMMHGTRGIAQLAAHRRANRNNDKNNSYGPRHQCVFLFSVL